MSASCGNLDPYSNFFDFLGGYETKEAEHLKAFLEEGKPVVQFDKITEHLSCPKLVIGDVEGAYQATQRLIQQVLRKISHLSGRMDMKNAHDRFKGYRKPLADHGLSYQEDWVKNCHDISEAEGMTNTIALLESRKPPDARLCITDLEGFSNWLLADYTSPTLSSVDQFGEVMGSKAVDLLIEQLKIQTLGGPSTLELKTQLVVRNSSQKG
jgi:LacI family transcriptional regulator